MANKGFFETKAGRLTIAFIVIMIAFCVIMAGISSGSDALCSVGFFVIVAAMLFCPIQTYILKWK